LLDDVASTMLLLVQRDVTVLARRAVSATRPPMRPAAGVRTVHVPGGRPARTPAALQRTTATDDSVQNSTGPFGWPVTMEVSVSFFCITKASQRLGAATNVGSTSMTSLQNKHMERVKAADAYSRIRMSSVGSKSSISQKTVVDFMTAEEQKRLKNQLSSPFSRQDIFYSGSVTSLHEYKTSTDMATYIKVIFRLLRR